jgi:hypothetical protein
VLHHRWHNPVRRQEEQTSLKPPAVAVAATCVQAAQHWELTCRSHTGSHGGRCCAPSSACEPSGTAGWPNPEKHANNMHNLCVLAYKGVMLKLNVHTPMLVTAHSPGGHLGLGSLQPAPEEQAGYTQ